MMMSGEEPVKYSTLFRRRRPSFLVMMATAASLLLLLASSCSGGLLSAYIRQNIHFHPYYVVQRIFDSGENETSDISSTSAENEVVANGEKGTPTLASSSSLLLQSSYTDCGSTASIKNLQLSPCSSRTKENSDICEIERGSNVTFNLSFVPKGNATQLKTVIHGIKDWIPFPIPSPEPDACQNCGIVCPLHVGQHYNYVLSAQVKESYPKTTLWVKGQLEDEEKRNVICVEVHVRIV